MTALFSSAVGNPCTAALCTKGAVDPSGIDANGWRRLCTAFKTASADLCHSLALLAKRISTIYVDPNGLSPFLVCRLIEQKSRDLPNQSVRDCAENSGQGNSFHNPRINSGRRQISPALCRPDSWSSSRCPYHKGGIRK